MKRTIIYTTAHKVLKDVILQWHKEISVNSM